MTSNMPVFRPQTRVFDTSYEISIIFVLSLLLPLKIAIQAINQCLSNLSITNNHYFSTSYQQSFTSIHENHLFLDLIPLYPNNHYWVLGSWLTITTGNLDISKIYPSWFIFTIFILLYDLFNYAVLLISIAMLPDLNYLKYNCYYYFSMNYYTLPHLLL